MQKAPSAKRRPRPRRLTKTGRDYHPRVDEALASELVGLADEDQRVRAELLADGTLFDGYNPRMEDVHVRNAARLEAVIDEHGWPGR